MQFASGNGAGRTEVSSRAKASRGTAVARRDEKDKRKVGRSGSDILGTVKVQI